MEIHNFLLSLFIPLGFSSEQVATVLRGSQHNGSVRLIVARPIEPTSPDYQMISSTAPIIPTKMLTGDPEELEKTLQSAGFAASAAAAAATSSSFATVVECSSLNECDDVDNSLQQLTITPSATMTHIEVVAVNSNNYDGSSNILISPASMSLSHSQLIAQYLDTPETETYEVELRKNVYGLGITVAGYVCEEEDLSGIFVKSIIEGSAAELSGKIQINDRIIAVDGRSLAGVSNYQAVEILRNTDIAVKLTLERFLRGRKYEHLQVALVDGHSQKSLPASPSVTTLSICPARSDADSIVTECGECEPELDCSSGDSNSIVENGDELPSPIADDESCDELKRNGDNNENETEEDEATPIESPTLDDMSREWQDQINNDYRIVVAEVNKLSGLGISLEGTVEIEAYGVEIRPHHYIRSILIEGPVGKDGRLKTGDELLQVNEHKLQGLKHTEVVKIIKNLPERVKIVCARGCQREVVPTSQTSEAFEARSILVGGLQSLCLPLNIMNLSRMNNSVPGLIAKALSESSLYTSSTATMTDQQKSKSMENISGLALWTEEVTFVSLEKTEKGFGFSILDYQDPLDSESTVIVVRGLIPGGSAENASVIFPGDRIISVNEHSLRNVTLDEAVQVLKSIPLGFARIGLCRPLSTSDNNLSSNSITPTT
jgi:C-terminal processing protease CtpA/Prc